jgi:hypothetical protein
MGDKIKGWHSKKPRNMKGFKRRREFIEGSGVLADRESERRDRRSSGKNWNHNLTFVGREEN